MLLRSSRVGTMSERARPPSRDRRTRRARRTPARSPLGRLDSVPSARGIAVSPRSSANACLGLRGRRIEVEIPPRRTISQRAAREDTIPSCDMLMPRRAKTPRQRCSETGTFGVAKTIVDFIGRARLRRRRSRPTAENDASGRASAANRVRIRVSGLRMSMPARTARTGLRRASGSRLRRAAIGALHDRPRGAHSLLDRLRASPRPAPQELVGLRERLRMAVHPLDVVDRLARQGGGASWTCHA